MCTNTHMHTQPHYSTGAITTVPCFLQTPVIAGSIASDVQKVFQAKMKELIHETKVRPRQPPVDQRTDQDTRHLRHEVRPRPRRFSQLCLTKLLHYLITWTNRSLCHVQNFSTAFGKNSGQKSTVTFGTVCLRWDQGSAIFSWGGHIPGCYPSALEY